MKKIINLLLLLSIGLFVFSSCKGDDDTTEDLVFDYHAHIHSPSADIKHVGDSIHIHVELESHTGEAVHHANVRIISKSDLTEIYNKPDEAHVHEADGKFEFHDNFVLSNANGVTEHTDWYLIAKVWGNEPGLEETIDTVGFHVMP